MSLGQTAVKERDEKITYNSDFGGRLSSGDSLDSVDSVEITKKDTSGAETDALSEFGTPTGAVVDDDVQFTLDVAGAGDQDPDAKYHIRIVATTANGEKLVNVHRIFLTATADRDTP